MLRDREIWMTALCFWLISVMMVGIFVSRWPPGLPLLVPILGIVAMPVSLGLAIFERRSEARDAQERAALRAKDRYEEAAEWQTDGYYIGWIRYRIAQAGLALLLAIAGVVLLTPLVASIGLVATAFPVWWAYRTQLAHKADIEHRRTSKQRIAAATDVLEQDGWNR